MSVVDAAPPDRLQRDRLTLAMYGTLGLLGFWLNGLGSILTPMREDLGVSRSAVAFYPSLFAVTLFVMGVVGAPLTRVLGRTLAMRAGVLGMVAGAVLLTLPTRALTLTGALLLGIGCSLTLLVVPVTMDATQGRFASQANTEANAVSSVMSVLPPLSVAAAIASGIGWRVGYLLPLVLAVVVLLLHPRVSEAPAASIGVPSGAVRQPLRWRWLLLVLMVSVEFCFVLWAAEAFLTWHQVSLARATALASAFLAGMATGRIVLSRGIARHSVRFTVWRQIAVAGAGFVLLWLAPNAWVCAVGLLLAGLGVSVLYPVGVLHAVRAWPDAPDAAGARALLASGVAIGLAPQALARLADIVDLRTAYLIVPVVLVAMAAVVPIAVPREH